MSKGDTKPGGLSILSQDAVSRQLERLSTLDATQLRTLWPRHFDGAPPPRMRSNLLARILAHDVQTRAFGGLSKSDVETLDRVAATEIGELRQRPSASVQRQLTPGTRLVRQWHGVTHEVCITEQGFIWRGTTYRSLSAVARAITGTRWNGPAFFGLRSKGGP